MKIQFTDLISEKTSHSVGEKYVLLKQNDVLSQLTQAAVGVITKEDDIDFHVHPTMEEFYFFLEGNATFIIDNEHVKCEKNTFVFVPNNISHKLTTNNYVKFLYWGIAI